ncbi:hypothetical protein BOX15_Mlig029716g2, partial [Macrostomum lignano]
ALQAELSTWQLEQQLAHDSPQQQQQQVSPRLQTARPGATISAAGLRASAALVEQLRQQLRDSEAQRQSKEAELQAMDERLADLELQLATAVSQPSPQQQQQQRLPPAGSSDAASARQVRELNGALRDMSNRVAQLQRDGGGGASGGSQYGGNESGDDGAAAQLLQRTGQELAARLAEMQAIVGSLSGGRDAATFTPTATASTAAAAAAPVSTSSVLSASAVSAFTAPVSSSVHSATAEYHLQNSEAISELRRQLGDRERQLVRMREELSSARQQCDQLEVEKTQLAARMNRQLATAESSLAKDLENQLSAAKQRLADRDERIRQLEREAAKARDLQSEFDFRGKTIGDLQASVGAKDAQLAILNKDLERFKAERASLNRSVQDLQTEVKCKLERIGDLEAAAQSLRDELTSTRKQLVQAESDSKSAREELGFKEERLRHTNSAHAEEVNRLRSANTEANELASQLKSKLDAKDQEIKKWSADQDKIRGELEACRKQLAEAEKFATHLQAELEDKMVKLKRLDTEVCRAQAQEIDRLQKTNDDYQNRLTQTQSRLEERELRMRRLEQENTDLLDEIHELRKKTYELEGQCDTLRGQLMERGHNGGMEHHH